MANEYNNEEMNAVQQYGQQVYVDRAIESAVWESSRLKGKKGSIIHLSFLSKVYTNRKQWHEALSSLEQIIDFLDKDDNDKENDYHNLFDTWVRYINLHIEIGEYDRALSLAKKEYRESRALADIKGQLDFLTLMAKVFAGKRDYKRAKRIQKEAYKLGIKFKNPKFTQTMEQNIEFIKQLEKQDPARILIKCLP